MKHTKMEVGRETSQSKCFQVFTGQRKGNDLHETLHLRHVLLGVLTQPFQSYNLRLLRSMLISVAREMTQAVTKPVVILQTWWSTPWRTRNIRIIKALERHVTLINMYHPSKKSLLCCCCVKYHFVTAEQNQVVLFCVNYHKWSSNQPS